jgi:protein SCO1
MQAMTSRDLAENRRSRGLRRLALIPVLSVSLWLTPSLAAQVPAAVGVDEKLGKSVPLDLTLKDEDGKPVTLRSLVDTPTILTLNYFRCAGICTPILNSVAGMAGKLTLEPDRDYRIVTVSFDDRDTPEIASRKRANYLKQMDRPFPPSGWRFLTGDAKSTKELCDAVGFTFEKQGEDFIHPGVIVFLSPEGKITRYMYGITFLPADVQMALTEAAKGQAEPTVNRLLQFCFRYDPQGRRFVFSATRLAGTTVLLAALGFVAFLVIRGRRRPGESEGDTP